MLDQFDPGSPLKDRVYETLKSEIIMGGFKAGQQLNIVDLATRMGISGAPVREALSMLHQNGFVVLTPRKKAIVAEVSAADYGIMMELRQMLEPYAAKISVGRIPAEQLAAMRVQLEYVLRHPDDMRAYIESDMSLHRLMSAYCGSHILCDLLKTIKEHSLRIRYCVEEMAGESKKAGFVVTVTGEHLDILEAWERGDADDVYEKAALHLKNYIRRSNTGGILEQFLQNRQALAGKDETPTGDA
ncbi:MAG: GntR family transcriptional regulator [Deltaproteobacteria bacterium]|nr:GntR family transcriptional regulator [Deltaproteobacteria bacterium]